MQNTPFRRLPLAICFFMLLAVRAWAQTPVPLASQPGFSYTATFTDIPNWANNFASGIEANRFQSVGVVGTATIPDPAKTTKSSATFVTGGTGGVQKGTDALVLLSTGATNNTESVAVDFLVDFTGLNAGTLSFDAATVFNSTGNRPATLKVYGSVDGGTTFTDLGANYTATNNVTGASSVSVTIPATFNNVAAARFRLYEFNGSMGGTAGSRPKISIDNLTVNGTSSVLPVHNLTQNTYFNTIQAAVDAATAGDVLLVAAGTYAESVTVNKSLTIKGANAGSVGFGTRTGESIIDGAGIRTGLVISAPNVVIDGFRFIGGQGTYGAGLSFNAAQPGAQIVNNIFADNAVGISEPQADALIRGNLFDGNNRSGAAGGSGIYTDLSTNGLTIDDNEFKNHANNSAIIFGATAANTHQNLTVTKNYIHDNNANNSMVYCVGINGGNFAQNHITQPFTTALKFAGANAAITVQNNFLDNNGVGIRIADDGFGLGSNSTIAIHNNSLHNATTRAIDNQEAATVDATCNWYGTTNVDGQATRLFAGAVTYSPYLNNATDSDGPAPGFQPVPASCVTNTAPTVANAIPAQMATVGQAYTYDIPANTFTDTEAPGSLLVTVSGLPTGLSFTAPATISGTPSTLTGSPFSVTATATDPGNLSVATTFMFTINAANMAPIATANANQTATVGVAFTYTINAFTDEMPNSLTYTASVSPVNGLSFDPATRIISGTPSVSGVSSVTVTATDPGSLSASTSFTITVNPAPVVVPSGPFSITGVTTVSCATITAGQRQVSFVPRYAGLSGAPVSFSVVNELSPTTATGPYTLNLYTDNPSVTLKATQSGTAGEASFVYNWLAACNGGLTPPINQAPVVSGGIAAQSATVGEVFTYVIAGSAFSDPNGDALTYSVSGLPAGLVFTAPATLSGTPSVSGVSTVTVTATDPGSLSVSTSFMLVVNPAVVPGGPFSITGVTTVSCATITAGQRQVSFVPRYVGLSGAPVSFSVVNELSPTTATGPYTLNLYTDNPSVTLKATQSGTAGEASFTYNWLAACAGGSGRLGARPSVESELDVQVLGNPAQNGYVLIEVRGAAGQSLDLSLTNGNGQVISSQQIRQAASVEHHTFDIGRQPLGLLLLRVTTPDQSKTVKVINGN